MKYNLNVKIILTKSIDTNYIDAFNIHFHTCIFIIHTPVVSDVILTTKRKA